MSGGHIDTDTDIELIAYGPGAHMLGRLVPRRPVLVGASVSSMTLPETAWITPMDSATFAYSPTDTLEKAGLEVRAPHAWRQTEHPGDLGR